MNNVTSFKRMKKQANKIVMITAYDYPSGKQVETAGVDVILVGDSLGMVVLGYENTLEVTMEDIIHHTKATRRGAKDTFIVADMPYMSYHLDINTTKQNAAKLIVEGRANAVKLEGGSDSRLQAIKEIVDCEIPVVAHLGLTPQSVNKLGGYRVQGKSEDMYNKILLQAKKVENAGAFMLVLEGVPEALAKEITESISIPTIGIGAGKYTDGQVLVYHDMLGIYENTAKFVKEYAKLDQVVGNAIQEYIQDVKDSRFPENKHTYVPIK